MVLLLDHHTAQTPSTGHALTNGIIDVIGGSFRDVVVRPVPPDPAVPPSGLSQPKIFAIAGTGMSNDPRFVQACSFHDLSA